IVFVFFFQAEDGIRDKLVTGVQTCALPIYSPFRMTLRDYVFTSESVNEGHPDKMYYDWPLSLRSAALEQQHQRHKQHTPTIRFRSEERRVGKECSSRWSRYA